MIRSAILVKYERSGKFAIKVTFPFSQEDLARVRKLPDRKWNAEGKFWIAPLSVDAVEMLKQWHFTLDPRLEEYLQHVKVNVNQVAEIDIPGLEGELRPFQKKGVGFVEVKNGRALIGDDMGLGKTIEALAWLQLHPELRPTLIVVPATVKIQWMREAIKWMPNPRVQILSGTSGEISMRQEDVLTSPRCPLGEITIINYDILPHWYSILKEINFKIMVIDECHYIKNNSAKRTKAVKRLGKNIPHILALSGTPIVSRPIEIFNAVNLIDSTIFPNRWEFGKRYCGLRHNGFGWDFSGATHTEELYKKLTNTIMIRRKKADVLLELPDKVRSYIPMELDNASEYKMAESNFVSFVHIQKGQEAANRASNAEALAEIEGLKQLAVKGKLKQAIDWIEDFLNVNGKLVVFAVHKFVIDALMERFGSMAVKVDGSVTGVNRQKAVDIFQTDDNTRLFIGNVKAAGIGITLTAASNVAFLELPWTPGEVTQAEDRTHRIGQKNSVAIYYLLAADTIEEKIAKLIDKKRKVLDSVLDGKATETESLLSELMKEYK